MSVIQVSYPLPIYQGRNITVGSLDGGSFVLFEVSYTMHAALHFVTLYLSSKQKRLGCHVSDYTGIQLLICVAVSSRAEKNVHRVTSTDLVPSFP